MSPIPKEGLVLVDGRRCSPAEATVSVYDRGFLYGDSVFEVIRTYGGRSFGLRDHVERLHRSADKLEMTLPWTVESMIEEVEGAVRASGFAEVYVRIVVTRGSGPLGLDPDLAEDPLRVVIVHPLVLPDESVYRDGVAVLVVDSIRATDGTVAEGAKASNYLANLLSLRDAKRRGAYEPVFVRRRGETVEVLEGGTSNVFALFGRALVTPPEGRILAGITRHYLLEAAREAGLDARIEPLSLDRLLAADEVFLTSTIREVVPVVRVLARQEGRADSEEAHVIGSGKPGEGVRALHAAFRKRVGAPTSPMPWEPQPPKNG